MALTAEHNTVCVTDYDTASTQLHHPRLLDLLGLAVALGYQLNSTILYA